MKILTQILLVISIALAVTHTAKAQDSIAIQPITIKGTSISIIPPKHFVYDSISGRILHEGSMSSIQVNEIKKRNYKKITSALTEKYMQSQGLELLDRQETTLHDGNEAIVFRCRFKSHDAKGMELIFIRLMFFTGKENTIWVTADFPECIAKQIEAPITNSIKAINQN